MPHLTTYYALKQYVIFSGLEHTFPTFFGKDVLLTSMLPSARASCRFILLTFLAVLKFSAVGDAA